MSEPLCDDLGFLIARTHRAMRRWLASRLDPFDITHEQFAVLACLWDEEGLSQTELAERAYADETSLTRMLQRMEESELIRREGDEEDQRVNRVHLTAAARDLEAQVIPLRQRGLRQATEGLSSYEVRELKRMLNRVFENLAHDEL